MLKGKQTNNNDLIYDKIQEFKNIVQINDNEFIEFFKKNDDLIVSNLIPIFEYIEEEYYSYFFENINEKFKEKISESDKNNIYNKFNYLKNEKEKEQSLKILKKLLIKFVVRFILGNDNFEPKKNCIEIISKNKFLLKEYNEKKQTFLEKLQKLESNKVINLIKLLSDKNTIWEKKKKNTMMRY